MLRGRRRWASAWLRELAGQRPRVEARNLRSKDVVASANVDGLQEFFLPKSPDRHRGQPGLPNKFIERHRRFRI